MFENKKKTLWIISIILMLLVPTTGVLARGFEAGTNAIAPQSEAQECEGFDYALKFQGNDLTDPKTKTGDGNSITIKNFTTKTDSDEIVAFDWTATVCIGQVVVKAGHDGGYSQTYDNAKSGSEATLNDKGLSHVTFCWNEPKKEEAEVEVTVGACVWNEQDGSKRDVTLTITGASVTITKTGDGTEYGPYTSTQTISLPDGDYTYTYTATTGYTGSGDGNFTVDECPEATVVVDPQGCEWDAQELTSSTDVVLTIENATLTITGPNGYDESFTSSQTITLPPGSYSYSWTADSGYSGSGSGSFTLLDCEPGKGEATIEIGACEWDATNGSLVNVIITIESAEFTIDGKTYTESTEIKLSPGTYAYSWVATGENEGSGDGEITIYGCEPASVTVDPDVCVWDGSKSVTDVTLTISGATLTIFQDSVEVGTYTASQTISLPEGEYTYTWEAIDENYTGSGSGSFTLVNCEPGVASASVSMGACVFDNNTSLTPVTITLNFAELTINGETYTESTVIQLEPGEYIYNWEASDEEHEGEGSGTLAVVGCAPKKDEDTPDPAPDVAAGGQGPTLFSIFTPVFAAIAGLVIAWSVLKNKVMKNR